MPCACRAWRNQNLPVDAGRPVAPGHTASLRVLFNRPIGTGQSLTPCDLQPARFIITNDIEDSPQLRNWLARRIGDEVEIVEPQDLLERSD